MNKGNSLFASQIADKVMVMYLGKVMEFAEKKELFEQPIHPYTKALLQAIPSIESDSGVKKELLQGDIPSPIDPPMGCVFHTRCPYCDEVCKTEEPVYREIAPSHMITCHYGEKFI